MILALLVTISVLVILLWVTIMFIWWQKEKHAKESLATDALITYAYKGTRLARRGLYAGEMYARSFGTWTGEKMANLFFKLFPSAVPAFAKKDELVGLSHGPSSFFLLSISEAKKKLSAKKIKRAVS